MEKLPLKPGRVPLSKMAIVGLYVLRIYLLIIFSIIMFKFASLWVMGK